MSRGSDSLVWTPEVENRPQVARRSETATGKQAYFLSREYTALRLLPSVFLFFLFAGGGGFSSAAVQYCSSYGKVSSLFTLWSQGEELGGQTVETCQHQMSTCCGPTSTETPPHPRSARVNRKHTPPLHPPLPNLTGSLFEPLFSTPPEKARAKLLRNADLLQNPICEPRTPRMREKEAFTGRPVFAFH